MKVVKSPFRGKRGRTYQGAIMDAWLKNREFKHNIEEYECKPSVLVTERNGKEEV